MFMSHFEAPAVLVKKDEYGELRCCCVATVFTQSKYTLNHDTSNQVPNSHKKQTDWTKQTKVITFARQMLVLQVNLSC